MHPEIELTAYAAGALTPAEQARVAAHLEACADCRRAVAESRRVLDGLAASLPAPPEPDWGRYRAELRERIETRRRSWWARPWPAVAAAGLAAALVLLVVQNFGTAPRDLPTVEETVLGARLPMLQQYQVVERLDLLEDLDAIRDLDRLAAAGDR